MSFWTCNIAIAQLSYRSFSQTSCGVENWVAGEGTGISFASCTNSLTATCYKCKCYQHMSRKAVAKTELHDCPKSPQQEPLQPLQPSVHQPPWTFFWPRHEIARYLVQDTTLKISHRVRLPNRNLEVRLLGSSSHEIFPCLHWRPLVAFVHACLFCGFSFALLGRSLQSARLLERKWVLVVFGHSHLLYPKTCPASS